jgi:hypothetical protein
MASLLSEANEPEKGEGNRGIIGLSGPCRVLVGPSAHTFSAFSLALGGTCLTAGPDASWPPHAIFQGKDPKIEEFIPPGWYQKVPQGFMGSE